MKHNSKCDCGDCQVNRVLESLEYNASLAGQLEIVKAQMAGELD